VRFAPKKATSTANQGMTMRWLAGFVGVAFLCSGCSVLAVADAVVTTGAVVVKTGVQATGAVVSAVLPK